jgi:hypothetical protein
LVLIVLSDFDPDGEEIAHSLARSLRDDFGIEDIDAIKTGLAAEQIEKSELPPKIKAKKTSTNYSRFTKRHGDDVFELEALPPETSQDKLRGTIDQVTDVELFNAELNDERHDAQFLAGVRKVVCETLMDAVDEFGIDLGEEGA